MDRLRALALLTGLLSACYTRTVEAAYEDVGVGARTVGLGNAYTAAADDVYSIYYNPAGLGLMDRPQVATTYSKLFAGLSDNSNIQNSFMAYGGPLYKGRYGGYGLAWNYFTVDSLYHETSLFFSYGGRMLTEQVHEPLYGGLSLKYLGRGLGKSAVADNALGPTGAATGTPDPVLQNASHSNVDLDLGLLYQVQPRLTLGLAVEHLLEPNVAFSPGDTVALGRNVKLGAAYRTPFTLFSGDLDFLTAPDGSTDKVATVAAEKWLPTLLHGTFGLRGSLGVGTRDFRQLTTGLSYKIYRLQVDYGFAMPLGTVSSTFGNHRVGLSFKFGRAQAAEPKLSEAILENMSELAEVGTPEYRYQAEELALYKRTAMREFIRQATLDTTDGRLRDAADKLAQAVALNPADRRLAVSLERARLVAQTFPEVKGFQTDAAQAAVYGAVLDFLAERDKDALKKAAYAQTLNPAEPRYEALLKDMEGKAGISRGPAAAPAGAAPTLGMEKVVGADLALMEVALKEGDYPKVVKLAKEVLDIDPTLILAYKRLSAAQYALRQYPEALKSLRAAYKLERDDGERRSLKSYIDALVALMERQARETRSPLVAPAGPHAPSAPSASKAAKTTPLEIERMYEAGVDLYAQGRLSEASDMFQRVLDLDPRNVSVRRALDRVKSEILQGDTR